LAAMKRKVLLIDLDPQGNATVGVGVEKGSFGKSSYDLLAGHAKAEEIVLSIPELKLDVIPANGDLTAAEVELLSYEQREFCLKNALRDIRDQYDYIFIDCPPSLNMLTLNALVGSNSVLIPLQCEYFALEGLSALLDTIEQVQTINTSLVVEGILRTMYDRRSRLAQDVSAQLRKVFAEKVFLTFIPRNIRLAEAPSHGLPAISYDKYSNGAKAYLALAGEMLRRQDAANTKATAAA